jgi:hypothetical protein
MTNLPALNGTEKQIAYAADIRTQQVKKWAEVVDFANANINEYEDRAAQILAIEEIISIALKETDAKVWIDWARDQDGFFAVARKNGDVSSVREIYNVKSKSDTHAWMEIKRPIAVAYNVFVTAMEG